MFPGRGKRKSFTGQMLLSFSFCYLSMAPNSKYVILKKRKLFINEIYFHVVK